LMPTNVGFLCAHCFSSSWTSITKKMKSNGHKFSWRFGVRKK
jgi:hypothetical protein